MSKYSKAVIYAGGVSLNLGEARSLKLERSRLWMCLTPNAHSSSFNDISDISYCCHQILPVSLQFMKNAVVSWSDSCFLWIAVAYSWAKQQLAKTFKLTRHDTGVFCFLLILNQTKRELIGCRGYKTKCEELVSGAIIDWSGVIKLFYHQASEG